MSMIVRDKNFEVLSGQWCAMTARPIAAMSSPLPFCARCHGWLWSVPVQPDQGGAGGHARQHGLGRASRKYLDGEQGRLGEDQSGIGQFLKRRSGPDTVVRRLDPAQSVEHAGPLTGPKRTFAFALHMSAFDPKADINVGRFELLARRQAFKGGHAVRNEMERLTFCREDRLLRAAID